MTNYPGARYRLSAQGSDSTSAIPLSPNQQPIVNGQMQSPVIAAMHPSQPRAGFPSQLSMDSIQSPVLTPSHIPGARPGDQSFSAKHTEQSNESTSTDFSLPKKDEALLRTFPLTPGEWVVGRYEFIRGYDAFDDLLMITNKRIMIYRKYRSLLLLNGNDYFVAYLQDIISVSETVNWKQLAGMYTLLGFSLTMTGFFIFYLSLPLAFQYFTSGIVTYGVLACVGFLGLFCGSRVIAKYVVIGLPGEKRTVLLDHETAHIAVQNLGQILSMLKDGVSHGNSLGNIQRAITPNTEWIHLTPVKAGVYGILYEIALLVTDVMSK